MLANAIESLALAIATTGINDTLVEVRSLPNIDLNTHLISLEGAFGKAVLEIKANPSSDNPRSSEIAAYIVLTKLKNIVSAITF